MREKPWFSTWSSTVKTFPADPRFDPAVKMQVLAEHRGLDHLSLGPQHALVALPAGPIAGEPGRGERGAAVKGLVHRIAGRVAVSLGRQALHEERVVEPAGVHEAGEGSQEAETPLTLRVMQPRGAEPGR